MAGKKWRDKIQSVSNSFLHFVVRFGWSDIFHSCCLFIYHRVVYPPVWAFPLKVFSAGYGRQKGRVKMYAVTFFCVCFDFRNFVPWAGLVGLWSGRCVMNSTHFAFHVSFILFNFFFFPYYHFHHFPLWQVSGKVYGCWCAHSTYSL